MKAGDRLPDLERQIELSDMVAYGAATWDWHRLHYDPEHARRFGMRAPVVDGQMLGALLAEQVVRALGSHAQITRLYYRNRSPVHAGDRIVCEAAVDKTDGRKIFIEQTIRVGDSVVVAPAGAEVRWPHP
jgi:acyl dehydratase